MKSKTPTDKGAAPTKKNSSADGEPSAAMTMASAFVTSRAPVPGTIDRIRTVLSASGGYILTSTERVDVNPAYTPPMVTVHLKHSVFLPGERTEVFSIGIGFGLGDVGLHAAITNALQMFVHQNFESVQAPQEKTAAFAPPGAATPPGEKVWPDALSPTAASTNRTRDAEETDAGRYNLDQGEFIDTIVSSSRKTVNNTRGGHTVYSYFTRNHGEVTTILESMARLADPLVTSAARVIIYAEKKDSRFPPTLVQLRALPQ